MNKLMYLSYDDIEKLHSCNQHIMLKQVARGRALSLPDMLVRPVEVRHADIAQIHRETKQRNTFEMRRRLSFPSLDQDQWNIDNKENHVL